MKYLLQQKTLLNNWKHRIPRLDDAIAQMEQTYTLAVGFSAYQRIVPALFLDPQRYGIYVVHDVSDLPLLEAYGQIFCHEKIDPQNAAKVQSTTYLLRNRRFQQFLKERNEPVQLQFYNMTPGLESTLDELGFRWIGNRSETFMEVNDKKTFRQLLEQLQLPHMPYWQPARVDLLAATFQEVYAKWNTGFVVQRGNRVPNERSVGSATYLIHTQTDWDTMHADLLQDNSFTTAQISPYINGLSTSMLGCVTHLGVLTGSLQLQLVDVPEILYDGSPAAGHFHGHDWGYTGWDAETEQTAQRVVESIGAYLASKGYRGMFGIDFMYDTATHTIYPNECNPRYTGTLPVYSLMIVNQQEVPPIEFFHQMAITGVDAPFLFDAVNAGWKKRTPLAHAYISPYGAYTMKADITAGIYAYSPETKQLQYQRPGAFSWDMQHENEFIIIDSVPTPGSTIQQGVPRLFKLVFPRSIAQSSSQLYPEIGEILTHIKTELLKNQ